MKKSILIIALIGLTITVFSQKRGPGSAVHDRKSYNIGVAMVKSMDSLNKAAAPKPAVRPKVEYKPDPAKKFAITDLTADEIYMIIAEPEMWTALEYSDKLSGKQIQQRKAAAAAARAKVQNQIEAYLVADYKKFQADTAAKARKK